MKFALIALAALILGSLAYIRLSPTDPAIWHVDPTVAADPGRGGVLLPAGRFITEVTPSELLTRLDAIIRATPRARVLAGSVQDGLITYEIRSKWVGFPDYVTVRALQTDGGSTLAVLSRLRFGSSDLGVNRARLDGWLKQLQAVQQ